MFSSRRKPKRIARDEPEIEDAEDDNGPVVRRPTTVPRTKSKLRVAFNPGEVAVDGEDSIEPVVTKPLRMGPSASSRGLSNISTREMESEDRPTYNKSYLNELRNSTPSTPRDLATYDSLSGDDAMTLDVAAKFGVQSTSKSSAIPSASEIQEKKERRARLAKEQAADDYIPLEDQYDSDGEFKMQRMQIGSYLDREDKNSRLVRDDEDFAEGFNEFVDDPGRVTMGRKAMKEQAAKERQAIQEMINDAEGTDDDESDSEVERNYAYESAQTQHGMDGLAARQRQQKEAQRPRQPRETTQIPKLAVALGRLREAVQKIEFEKAMITRKHAAIQTRRVEIKASQEHIQNSLEEAAKDLEALKHNQVGDSDETNLPVAQRGLENFATKDTAVLE